VRRYFIVAEAKTYDIVHTCYTLRVLSIGRASIPNEKARVGKTFSVNRKKDRRRPSNLKGGNPMCRRGMFSIVVVHLPRDLNVHVPCIHYGPSSNKSITGRTRSVDVNCSATRFSRLSKICHRRRNNGRDNLCNTYDVTLSVWKSVNSSLLTNNFTVVLVIYI